MSEESRSSNGARGASGAARDPHAARESEKYAAPIASREYILETLRDEGSPIDLEALGERLGLDADEDATEALRRRVRAMIRDGQLHENRRRGLVPVDDSSLVAGRISAHPDGFGFLVSEEREKDVFLSAREMRAVLHGDRVVVNVTGEDRRGRPEGRIVSVVERANRSLVGRIAIEHGIATVAADSKRIHQDLLVEPGHRMDAEHGDMVVAEITEQPTRKSQPVGRIVEVLGAHLTPGMEIDVALHTHGIPVEWPDAVTEQAASFSTTVRREDMLGRKDVRGIPLVTIDGADARDFDDAVWCEPTESGWRLIVAIADVAHYVRPGEPLDDEAVTRGTSVYFPGRVVPMLPEVLSNGLCSLNPDVDRLCMLCDMTLDEEGSVRKARFHNGVLRSHARLTYSKVHEILTEPESSLRDEYEEVVPVLEDLHGLYEVLAKARRSRGAIEFDSNETRIVFDGERKISELVPVVRNDAHKLIEECMILANIQAAAFLEKAEIPALYRVHNGPKADRLEDLRAFLALHGLTVGGGVTPTAADYAKLSREIADRPDRAVIQTVMLRSMQQAVYQPKNEGHFGLALEQYAHFTSPIRRYPDLLVHRAIKHAISREKNAAYRYSPADMQALGESCSVYERRAEEASRDVVSWLKCEYMQQHVGGEFEGVVAAVTSFGLFVDLVDIHVEGLIHITNLSRDYYKFDSAAHALIGERTGQQYHLGDRMVVRVASVNLDERKIDFAEVSHTAAKARKGAKPALAVVDGGKPNQKAPASVEAGEGGKGKSRKRRSGKRRRAKERAAEAAAAEATDGTNGAAEPGNGAASAAESSEPAETEVSAERRRQLKRREKQRRRDEKRAARRAEKKAAEAATGKAAADGASAPDDRPAASTEAEPARKSGRGRRRKGKDVAPPVATRARSGSWASRPDADESASGEAPAKRAARVPVAAEPAVDVPRKPVSGDAPAEDGARAAADGSVSKKSASRTSTGTSAKKVAAKKSAAKKVAAKKTAAKKAAKVATKKAAAKKAAKVAAKKTAAKKASAKVTTKKAAAKKAAAKKAVAKVAAKKTAAKKASAKVAAKKAAAKKASARVAAKKAAAKKASAKVAAKKAAAKKAAAKKAVAKVAAKKTAAKKASAKVAAKKAAAKKASARVAAKKAAAKKAAAKKTAAKEVAAKKAAGKKTAAKVAAAKVVTKKRATKKSGGR